MGFIVEQVVGVRLKTSGLLHSTAEWNKYILGSKRCFFDEGFPIEDMKKSWKGGLKQIEVEARSFGKLVSVNMNE